MNKEHREVASYHRNIWITTMFLCSLGLLMIFSASESFELFQRQLVFILCGLLVCFIVQHADYKVLYRYAGIIYFLSIACIFLLLTSAGVSVNGATRWLKIAGVQFQVAETVKNVLDKIKEETVHESPFFYFLSLRPTR